MKIIVTEFDRCFGFELTAENMAEAATLVRFGMNRTEIRVCNASVCKDGMFGAHLVFGKSRRSDSAVPKRK